jgi:protein-disulfide isomerase
LQSTTIRVIHSGTGKRHGQRLLLLAAALVAGTVISARPALCQPASQYPGVDLSKLDASKRALLDEIVEEQFCPCGTSQSFKQTLEQPGDCNVATRLGNQLAEELAKGASKKDAVRSLLRRIATINARFEFDTAGSPRLGASDPRVTVVVFSDFECPYCRVIGEPLREIARKPGVAVVYKFFPLSFHEHADDAARAAMAAHLQGKFWPMHDLLFEKQKELDDAAMTSAAKGLGLDMKRFEGDRASEAVKARIAADKAEAEKAGVEGTPTLFVNGLILDDPARLEEAVEEARKQL